MAAERINENPEILMETILNPTDWQISAMKAYMKIYAKVKTN